MENNRNSHNYPHDYIDNNDYSNTRNSPRTRSPPLTPKRVYLTNPGGSKAYYKTQGNYPEYYTEDQQWNMEARRAAPNSSHSPSQLSHRQMVNQLPQTNPQIQGSSTRPGNVPLKGILVSNRKNNILEGQRRKVTARQYSRPIPRASTPNYKTATCTRNENSAPFCGGEPMSDNEDSQYYFIDEKNGQQNYDDNDKTIFDDQGDDMSIYKELGYNSSENEMFYDPRDFAALDLRERQGRKQPFPQQTESNHDHSNVDDPTYENDEPNYYRVPQPMGVPRQSTASCGQTRFQNIPRNGILTQPPTHRREMYKNMTEKLNETYNELKNAGISDRKEGDRYERGSSLINTVGRYSQQERLESNTKYNSNTHVEYQNDRPEFKDGDLYTSTSRYKYQNEMYEDNPKRSAIMSYLDKYKLGHHNPSSHYPLYKTQDSSNAMERKVAPLNSNKQDHEDDEFEESGSYVQMHNEYKKNQPVPGCCVDVYNNYRNDKSPDK